MKFKIVTFITALVIVLAGNLGYSQTPDPTITKLFQNSYKVIDAMRLPEGTYLDALAINNGAKPVALAANGVGLISLCIADAMYKKTGDAVNWDSNAENKALQTINEWIRLKNTAGAVNVNGLFHRYLNPVDGSYVWVTEHSTIDNAILAAGFLFCRNYFNSNPEIVLKTTTLLNSMDFTAAIPTSGNQMYMILENNGVGSALVRPFNEYLVLAWFAKNSNPSFPGWDRAQRYWQTYFSDANLLPKSNYPAGNGILSESSSFAQPSFHVQFCFYYCNYFANNADYMKFFGNQATADKTWWQNNTSQQMAWGCGAGEIPGTGYSADAVNNNPNRIVSPHIIAGFSPVNSNIKNDLIALYSNGAGPAVYRIPGTSNEFLWRYFYSNTSPRTSYVQAVDFSTMLYGLAALPEYLGVDFFKRNNTFSLPTSSNDLKESDDCLENYPNPFRDQTNIEFKLKKKSFVQIGIYSEDGQMVKQLINQEAMAGKYSVRWDIRDESNFRVKSGVYFCLMSIDNEIMETTKMLVVN